jgi:hypothetical protein
MATVFFTKDGQSPEQAHFVGELFVSDAVSHFGAYKRYYSPEMPVIGEITHLTDYSSCQHVIVRIGENETCPAFPNPGYYIINDLTISSAKTMMGIDVMANL